MILYCQNRTRISRLSGMGWKWARSAASHPNALIAFGKCANTLPFAIPLMPVLIVGLLWGINTDLITCENAQVNFHTHAHTPYVNIWWLSTALNVRSVLRVGGVGVGGVAVSEKGALNTRQHLHVTTCISITESGGRCVGGKKSAPIKVTSLTSRRRYHPHILSFREVSIVPEQGRLLPIALFFFFRFFFLFHLRTYWTMERCTSNMAYITSL